MEWNGMEWNGMESMTTQNEEEEVEIIRNNTQPYS